MEILKDTPKLKDGLSISVVEWLASDLKSVDKGFKTEDFIGDLTVEIERFELKERAKLVAVKILENSSLNFIATNRLVELLRLPKRSAWQYYMPIGEFVAMYLVNYPKLAFEVMELLTERFTAEFALRPFIIAHTDEVLRNCKLWATSDNEHHRRLASEGLRPFLPWSSKVHYTERSKVEVFQILSELKDDKSLYVRKSVANHLNDWSKLDANLVLKLCSEWKGGNENVNWVIRHGLRTLIKAGHPKALEIIGLNPLDGTVSVHLKLKNSEVEIGGKLTFEIFIASHSSENQDVMIDYIIYFKKSNGSLNQKVFKGSRRKLNSNQEISIVRNHDFRLISTRKYYVGVHKIELLVNGVRYCKSDFNLL